MFLSILRILGAIWVLPVALLIWAFYIFPCWALGAIQVYYVDKERQVIIFDVVVKGQPLFWFNAWKSWTGSGLPFAAIIELENCRSTQEIHETISHELRHCDQWLWLGPLFPVVYGILYKLMGYRDNPLEVDANNHEQEW